MSEEKQIQRSDGVAVQEAEPKLKRPQLYRVLLLNDDYTPMEFVLWSLQAYFSKSEPEANSIMLEVHKQGKAIAGVYDYQIAESKIYDVTESAREHNFPLKVTGEPE